LPTIDAGFGYTYLNPQTGHEFSGVLGFTYNRLLGDGARLQHPHNMFALQHST
jgi:hypothetical protein